MVEKDDTLTLVNREFKRTFGQNRVKEFLIHSLNKETFPHAMLIYGSKGLGQVPLLLDIADQLLCESIEKVPCGKCYSCKEKNKPTHENVIPIFPMLESRQKTEELIVENTQGKFNWVNEEPYGYFHELKEHISIGQIRQLRKRLSYASLKKIRRVVLIFGLESMMPPAANALLKMLEEPPANVYFLLSCRSRNNILPTILSRCISLGLSPLNQEDLTNFLNSSQVQVSDSSNMLPISSGSPGVLMDYINNGGVELLDNTFNFMEKSLTGDWIDFEEFISQNSNFSDMDASVKILQLALELVSYWNSNKGRKNELSNSVLEQLDNILNNNEFHHDFTLYVKFITDTLDAITKYSRPHMALLGNFLIMEENSGLAVH